MRGRRCPCCSPWSWPCAPARAPPPWLRCSCFCGGLPRRARCAAFRLLSSTSGNPGFKQQMLVSADHEIWICGHPKRCRSASSCSSTSRLGPCAPQDAYCTLVEPTQQEDFICVAGKDSESTVVMLRPLISSDCVLETLINQNCAGDCRPEGAVPAGHRFVGLSQATRSSLALSTQHDAPERPPVTCNRVRACELLEGSTSEKVLTLQK